MQAFSQEAGVHKWQKVSTVKILRYVCCSCYAVACMASFEPNYLLLPILDVTLPMFPPSSLHFDGSIYSVKSSQVAFSE